MASNGITFISYFLKSLSAGSKNKKGDHTDSMVISSSLFFLTKKVN
jgi:hypothetical protein